MPDGGHTVLAGFHDLEDVARPLFAQPGVSTSAGFYFASGLAGLRARHALAELALGAAAGGPSGDTVALAAAILPNPPIAPVLIEAYASAFLFGAWSCVETAVFAANALGAAVAPSEFASVDNTKALGRVDIAAVRDPKRRKGAYECYFPRFTRELLTQSVVRELEDHHNASKHREATVGGWTGAMRGGLDVGESMQTGLLRSGASEIRLRAQPKTARAERSPPTLPPGVFLPSGVILPEPTVSMTPIVTAWRELLAALGSGLRADVDGLLASAAT